MNINIETYKLFVLLGPGFIAWAIFRTFVRNDSNINLKIIFEVIAFSSVINFFVEILKTEYIWLNTITQLLLVFLLPILVSIFILKRYHFKWLKNFEIFKTFRKDAWLDTFNEENRYVRVVLNDGRILIGLPKYYTESNDGDKYIYIYHHEWLKNNVLFPSNMHGLLLKEDKIDFIEFYLENNECYLDKNSHEQEDENGRG